MVQNVFAIQQDLAFRALLRVELKHFVEGTQQRGFTAARRADKRGHFVFGDIQADVFQGMEFPVVKVQIANLNLARGLINHTHLNRFPYPASQNATPSKN
ncbi:FIG00116607: hypothetical protein [Cronobacter sakazakii 696]|nr:FIG00116607: hypothetical protein [Cronobacter sakazakii 696]